MNCFVVFSVVLAVAFGFHTSGEQSGSHGGFGDAVSHSVVSKRVASPATQDDLFNLIKGEVAKAHTGTTIQELCLAAESVLILVNDLLGGESAPVDPNAVRAQIEQSVAVIGGAQTAVSALFDDVMTYEGEKMATALKLWNNLVDTAREQQAAGQSTRTTLAAIRETARTINTIVADTVSAFTELFKLTGKNQESSNTKKRAVSKRGGNSGWSVGLDAGYGSHSGAHVGVNIGFSF